MTTLQKLLGQVKKDFKKKFVYVPETPEQAAAIKHGLVIPWLSQALTTAYNMGQQDLIDKIRNWIEPGQDPMENWKKVLNKLQALSSKKGRR